MIKEGSNVRQARTQIKYRSFGDKEAPVGGHALTGHVIAKLSTPRTVACLGSFACFGDKPPTAKAPGVVSFSF